jgi:hypothetical protein
MTEKSFKRTYESVYVAFLDILGFKDLVLNHSHEHLEALYLQKLSGTVEHALSNGKYVLVNDGETESLGPDIRKTPVNSLLISDSILLWTDDCEAESFVQIVTAVRSLLAFSVIDGFRLRGAIVIGPLTVVLNQWPSKMHSFQHSLFGRAIVDAVEAEKVQEWIGCTLSQDAIECYNRLERGESLIEKKVVVPYAIPLKEGKEMHGYVIDWANHPNAGIDFQTIEAAFAPTSGTTREEFEKIIKKKLENTLQFVKHLKPSAAQSSVLGGRIPF